MKKIASILLVDDDETTNYISKLIINRAGLTDELLIAQNGKEALALLQERCTASETEAVPALILLDINMPVMDGFKFLEVLQTIEGFDYSSVIIAVLTTSLDPRDIEKVKLLGVDEFISKPLTKESLELLIQKHFN
ncbi:response regulator [Pontibacter sp. BT310]|jgi:CheY-like chemotaxis protein|uniref:Response regulator n=1 Tax=Pontibacter populi TaxID=890055 RepID=A0ABS6XAN4_9BACT|nr:MULTISPECIES: response regulator [Pontibacter]MBJ6118224.1 response regulator [Pontibacter sp. BT310]MBR0570651.1 response regulator [Microvirga sp. STS03]MBW3365077.1 response regulator [Pontibacter populi]